MSINFLASINAKLQSILARSNGSFRNEVAVIDLKALNTERESIGAKIKTLEDEIEARDGLETEEETKTLENLDEQFVKLSQRIKRASRGNARNQLLNNKVDVLGRVGSVVSSTTNEAGGGSSVTIETDGDGDGNVTVENKWEEDPRLGYRNIGEFLNDVKELGQNAVASEKVRFLMNQDGGFTRGDGLVIPRGFTNSGSHMPGDAGTDALRPSPQTMPLMQMPVNDHDALFNAMTPTPIPMARSEVKVPFIRDKDRRHELFAGIMVTDRPDQAALENLSKMNFGKLEMKVGGTYTLACFHELLLAESAVSLLTLFTGNSNIAMQRTRIRYMLRGSSTQHFEGILTDGNPSLITIGRETPGTASYGDLLDMRNHCYGYGGSMWLASTTTLTQVERLNRALVNNGAPAIFSYSSENNSGILMGRPFIVSDDFQTADGLALINASHYYYGLYQSEKFGENPYLLWLEDKKIFKVTKREVGKVAWECPLIPELNNVPKSPFVILGAKDHFPECPEEGLKEYRIERATKFTERERKTKAAAGASILGKATKATAKGKSSGTKGEKPEGGDNSRDK